MDSEFRKETRQGGYHNYEWLRSQALNEDTLQFIDMREGDNEAFLKTGKPTKGDEEFVLQFKQGVFCTTRTTGHSISHIFVQIFKNKEHRLLTEFDAGESKVVVDIGANEGYYAQSMAKDPSTTVYAVEPNPIAYGLLCKNMAANNLDNVITLNRAIWSSRGMTNIRIIPQVTSIGTLSLMPTSYMSLAQDRVEELPVSAITLVDLVDMYGLSHIDILKIDVEGAEMEVIKGGLAVLTIVDRLVIEYHSQELKSAIISLLDTHGFDLVYRAPDRTDFGDLYFARHELKRDNGVTLSESAREPIPYDLPIVG